MYDILTLCNRDIKKTHIMYKANLSHLQLEKYLRLLIDKELLSEKNGKYVTTSKGHRFLEEFRKIQSILGEEPHTISGINSFL